MMPTFFKEMAAEINEDIADSRKRWNQMIYICLSSAIFLGAFSTWTGLYAPEHGITAIIWFPLGAVLIANTRTMIRYRDEHTKRMLEIRQSCLDNHERFSR